jgi:hypothetical protein
VVGAFGRDELDRSLHGGEAGQAQVQQDERIRDERLVACANDDHIERDPHGEEQERTKDERPRSHAVAHVVSCGLADREFTGRQYGGVAVPHHRPTPAVETARFDGR